MSSPTNMPLRIDAERNRERILQVAYEALTANPAASLNAIAKQAGVGPGTLYRHFPSREALLVALYRHEITAIVEEASILLAEHEPLDAFRAWFRRLAALLRLKHGLGDALHSEAGQQAIREAYEPVTAAIQQLLNAGVEARVMRPGVDPYDILILMGALWRVSGDPEGLAQADRMLELVIGGLRADSW